jgi:hypothetical protein
MTTPDTDTLAGLREELRLIGCHQNGDARCTCSIGADALDAIDALRAQAAKDKARIERLEAALRFYADISDYRAPLTGGFGKLFFDCGAPLTGGLGKLFLDRGQVARAALEDGE